MNILLCVKGELYREGITTMLSHGSYRKRAGQFFVHTGETIGRLTPDIILSDENSLDRDLFRHYPQAKIVMINTCLSPEYVMMLASLCKIRGVITPPVNSTTLSMILEKIYAGGVWPEPERGVQMDPGTESAKTVVLMDTSEREKEIIEYVCIGYSNKKIAARLRLSEHTIKTHIGNIFRKYRISSRVQLAAIEAERKLTNQSVTAKESGLTGQRPHQD
ncbi:MAG: response regulator transcription factor [Nitrospirales bacterium]|nr:response regulator transcription factor [Nitrospirales bacterium]